MKRMHCVAILAGLLLATANEALADLSNFILQWGTAGTGPGQFNLPLKVAVDASGFVYVVDVGNNRVEKFNPLGGFVTMWGSPGSGPGQFNSPSGIAADLNGRVFVTDHNNRRVQVFDSSGNYLYRIGATIAGTDSSLDFPNGLTVDTDGSVYVTAGENFVAKFTSAGQFVRRWYDQLSSPMDLVADGAGQLYILSSANSTVVVTDTAGTVIRIFGQEGSGPGDLNGPLAIDRDPNGNLVILDSNNWRVEVLSPFGAYLGSWELKARCPASSVRPSGSRSRLMAASMLPTPGTTESKNSATFLWR